MARFINRKIRFSATRKALMPKSMHTQVNETSTIVIENKEDKKVEDMTTQEKIMQASSIMASEPVAPVKVKKVKRDKGLIERTESSKIVLTEDNKELLND